MIIKLLSILLIYTMTTINLTAQADPLIIDILDVGEGQATLLHKNRRAILIDTGHAGMAARVLKKMHTANIEQLDYLILSHLHPDHASGYFRIQEAYPDTPVLYHCQHFNDLQVADTIRWISASLQNNERLRCIKAGDSLAWSDVQIDILWPPRQPLATDSLNHHSLVILAQFRQQSLLVMGDADQRVEQELLKKFDFNGIDILLVGHHGADDASSEDFLQQLQPKHAAVSVNAHNLRGYPSADTMQRLARYADHLHLTHESGDIRFEFK